MYRPASIRPLLPLVLGLLFWAGCDGSDPEPDATGSVTGQVTAADGVTPIPGATVALASASGLAPGMAGLRAAPLGRALSTAGLRMDGPTTTTDQDGRFTLDEVPVGEQTLVAKSGVFEATFTVDVEAGAVTTAPVAPLQSTLGLAYVAGSFDSIEDIVTELGNEIAEIGQETLADADALSRYGIVFLNCGSVGFYSDEQVAALRAYMQAGGTVYASDLEAPLATQLFNTESQEVIQISGNSGSQTIVADVVSPSLEAFVGQATVEIEYDLFAWQRVTDFVPGPGREVLLEGVPEESDGAVEPLAVRFDVGRGRFIYTSFHNEAGATADQEEVLRYYIYFPS